MDDLPDVAMHDRTAGGGGVLRQFAYLDETGVMSLLASLEGTVPAELKQQGSAVTSQSISAKAGATVPGVVDMGVNGTSGNSTAMMAEVLRVFTVQAAFGRLHQHLSQRLALSTLEPTDSARVADHDLSRGDAIEVRAAMEVDGVYRARTVLASLVAVAERAPAMFEEALAGGNLTMMAHVLEELLKGQVPIRGRLADYMALEEDGKYRVCRVDQLVESEKDGARPIDLVAMLDAEQLWDDPRQALFSGLEFVAMGRLRSGQLVESWEPMLLGPVLSQVDPKLREAFVFMRESIDSAFNSSAGPANDGQRESTHLFGSYLAELANAYGIEADELSDPDANRLAVAAAEAAARSGDLQGGYRMVEDAISAASATPIDRAHAAKLRPGPIAPRASRPTENTRLPLYLEADLLGVYW